MSKEIIIPPATSLLVTQCCNVVCTVSVSDVLASVAKMPFTNRTAWKSAQYDCQTLRRAHAREVKLKQLSAHAHLTQGTRPVKKACNIKDLKRFLQVATVNCEKGLSVCRQQIVDSCACASVAWFTHRSAHQLQSSH